MTDTHNPKDDNFVMNEESASDEADDDREEYFEAPVSRLDFKSRIPLILGGIGLVLVVILVWLFLSGGRQPTDSNATQKLMSRLTQLEEKLAKLEWLDQGLARLDKQEKNYEALVQKIDRIEGAMKQQSALIEKKIQLLGTRPPTAESSPKKPTASNGKAETATTGVHVVKSGEIRDQYRSIAKTE
jgi:Tfp pilus assembly protein PilN